MNNMFKNLAIWLVIGLVLMTVFNQFNNRQVATGAVEYSQFIEEVKAGRISKVVMEGRTLKATTSEGKRITSYAPPDLWLVSDLLKNGVKIEARPEEEPSFLMNIFVSWFPMLLLIGVWVFFMRQMQGGGKGGAFSFGKSKARMTDEAQNTITFVDVAGCDEAKEEVQEIVDFLRDPSKFQKLGGRIPKGVLMVGNPGTGKTLLAKAIAGEAKVPFFSISGSDFVEMFVGVGAARVRDMFENAKKHAPCIIFIDEIDAVGRHRGAGLGGGNDEREQTLNQLLVEMDGFEGHSGIIVIAATNRPDILDPALLRPGRFDRHVTVDLPVREGRLGILKVHTRKVPLDEDVRLNALAQSTIGYSGAELQKLVNEAALKAARDGKRRVSMDEFLFAQDLVMMGAMREEQLDETEKKLTAWHEAGHAVLAWFQEGMDVVHKVTIIPRGRALGVTQLMPEKEIYNVGETILRKRLVMMLGGRAAEKLVFDEVSAGAENDIERATSVARKMVASWGMSETVGPVSFKQSEEHPFLGKEMHTYREFSEETARIIDIEVQRIMNSTHERAVELLTLHRAELDALANALLEHEHIERTQIRELLGPRPGETDDPSIIQDEKSHEQSSEDGAVTEQTADQNVQQRTHSGPIQYSGIPKAGTNGSSC